jgi:hypothetical protein
MVKISIFCSNIYSGDSEFVGGSNFDDYSEFLDFAKRIWLRCNVTSETHECEAIASAENPPEGFPSQFGLGLFVFHYNKRKGTHEISISHTINDDYVEAFEQVGMSDAFQNSIPEEELFRSRFEFLKNLNNPHRLLGTWIKNIDDEYDLYELLEKEKNISEASNELIENSLLSTVLNFARKYRKTTEILYWLGSRDGKKFLSNFDEYDSASGKLSSAADVFLKVIKKSKSPNILIDEFISRFESNSIPEPLLF